MLYHMSFGTADALTVNTNQNVIGAYCIFRGPSLQQVLI